MSAISLYQIVHTLEGRIIALDAHLKLLFDAYYEVFHSGVRLPLGEIRSRIESLLLESGCGGNKLSVYVRISISDSAEVDITLEERAIYGGYSLRCLSPKGALVSYDIPYINYPTSVRYAATQIANLKASREGADIAIRLKDGVVDLANGAQLFAVKGFSIYTSFKSYSVEHSLALKAIGGLALTLEDREIEVDDLPQLDELFYADHYGITSISRCGARYYMSIVAGEVAQLMSEL